MKYNNFLLIPGITSFLEERKKSKFQTKPNVIEYLKWGYKVVNKDIL